MREPDEDRYTVHKKGEATKDDIEADFEEINTYVGLRKIEMKVVSVFLSCWGLWESLIGILCYFLRDVEARRQHV